MTASLAPPPADRTAEVLVRPGAAHGLRRHARAPPSRPTAPPRLGAARRDVRLDGRVRRRGPRVRRRRRRAGPADLRDHVVRRLREAAGSERRCALMSGARDQVARLLALVPYIQARREVSLEQAAGRLRGAAGPDRQGPQRAVVLRAARPGHGRPDRRRHGGARGRGRDPGVQRRLPQPAAAPGQLRGVRADRRAAGAAGGQRRRRPPDRGPHAGQAGGRRRGRRRARGAGRHPAARSRPAGSPRCATGSPRAVDERRQVRLDYYVPARDESTERVVDPLRVVTADGNTYLDAYCHLAEDQRLFRLDRISTAEVLDTPVEQHAGLRAPRPRRRHLPAVHRRPAGHPATSSPAPAGSRSTTRSRAREAPRRRPARAAAGRRPGLADPADAAARGDRPSWWTRPTWPTPSARWPRQASAQLRLRSCRPDGPSGLPAVRTTPRTMEQRTRQAKR